MTDSIFKIVDPNQKTDRHDLLNFGLDHIAYIRTIQVLNRSLFSIHAADGTPLSIVENEPMAHEMIARNNLESVRVH